MVDRRQGLEVPVTAAWREGKAREFATLGPRDRWGSVGVISNLDSFPSREPLYFRALQAYALHILYILTYQTPSDTVRRN